MCPLFVAARRYRSVGNLGAGTAACGGDDVVTEVTQATVAGVGSCQGR